MYVIAILLFIYCVTWFIFPDIVEDVVIPFYKDVLRSTREDILVSIYDSFFRKETTQSPEEDALIPTSNLTKFKRCNGLCPRPPTLSRKSAMV